MSHLVRVCYLFLFVLSTWSIGRAASVYPDSSRRAQSVSLHLGTTGPRLFYNHALLPAHRLSVRAGVQYIAYRQPFQVAVSKESNLTLSPDFMIGVVQAGLVWRPFKRGSFFVTGGAGYTWHPNLNVVMTTDNKLDLDGIELTPEDVGTVNLGLRWHSVVGYAGLGFGRTIPRRRVGVGVELGVFYLGRPRVSLDYSGFLETTTIDEQIPRVEQNLAGYRYLPSLNVTVTYRLNRP
jgi:hypothetical protein